MSKRRVSKKSPFKFASKGTKRQAREKLGKETLKAQKILRADFVEWQNTLVRMIRDKSKIEANPDGSVQYILPKELVELVWTTSIYEFIKIEKMKAEKEEGDTNDQNLATKAAVQIKKRVEALAKQITGEQDGEEEETENRT